MQDTPTLPGKVSVIYSWYNFRQDTRFNRNLLCVPFVNDRELLQGYQSIAPDGTKRFCGSIGGYFWQYPITNPNDLLFDVNNSFFILCEGVATGISAYEALINHFDNQIYLPIILCAFNVGNLDKVIKITINKRLPYFLLIDNDSTKPRNARIETAKQLIIDNPDAVIYPVTFDNGTDANDYILANGSISFINLICKQTPLMNFIGN